MRTILAAGLALSLLAFAGAHATVADDLVIPAQGKPPVQADPAPAPPAGRPPAQAPQTPPAQAQPTPPPQGLPPLASADEIRTVQTLLGVVGIDPGGNDGVLTDRTREAIRQFQRQ